MNTSQKKYVKNIGLFSLKHWSGLKQNDSDKKWVYQKLKEIGFKETVWQFVYNGQIGGLIYLVDNGHKEIHVRFFEKFIEAEIEVGRNYINHFIAPRYQAEKLVLKMLANKMNSNEYDRIKTMFREDNNISIDISKLNNKGISYDLLSIFLFFLILFIIFFGFLSYKYLFIIIPLKFLLYKSLPRYYHSKVIINET